MFSLDVWNAILEHTIAAQLPLMMRVCKSMRPVVEPLLVEKYLKKKEIQLLRRMFFDVNDKLRAEFMYAWGQQSVCLVYEEKWNVCYIKGNIHGNHFYIGVWNQCLQMHSYVYQRDSCLYERYDSLCIYRNRVHKDSVYHDLPSDLYAFVRDAIFGRFPWAA